MRAGPPKAAPRRRPILVYVYISQAGAASIAVRKCRRLSRIILQPRFMLMFLDTRLMPDASYWQQTLHHVPTRCDPTCTAVVASLFQTAMNGVGADPGARQALPGICSTTPSYLSHALNACFTIWFGLVCTQLPKLLLQAQSFLRYTRGSCRCC